MVEVYFKRHNRAVLMNSEYIGLTGETEISKERAIELIKNKKARLVLNSNTSIAFGIIKEAIAGAGAAIPPNKVITILDGQEIVDAAQQESNAIIVENMADEEIELDSDFIAVIKGDIDNLEMVSYGINIKEDREVIVEYKRSKMTAQMFNSRMIDKLTFRQMHYLMKRGFIVKMYELGIINIV